MKDRLGQELEIGDHVITLAKNYRNMVDADVIKLTPEHVEVQYLNTWNFSPTNPRPETYRVKPVNVVKVT